MSCHLGDVVCHMSCHLGDVVCYMVIYVVWEEPSWACQVLSDRDEERWNKVHYIVTTLHEWAALRLEGAVQCCTREFSQWSARDSMLVISTVHYTNVTSSLERCLIWEPVVDYLYVYYILVEPLLKDIPNKGHHTFNLCTKYRSCGPYRTMAM